MSPGRRRVLHALGLAIFAAILILSIRQAPPRLAELDGSWLTASLAMAGIAMVVQARQVLIFLRCESLRPSWRWTAWFASEKAWMNTVLPGKVGTVGAVFFLKSAAGLGWSRYLRFMLLCSALTVAASAAGLIVLFWPGWAGALAALATFIVGARASVVLYPIDARHLVELSVWALLALASLGLGVGACIRGLGYSEGWADVIPIAVVLNLLSIVAITPGNFGVREALLTMLSPLLNLDFAIIVQATTCYLFFRLLICLVTATTLRPYATTASLE